MFLACLGFILGPAPYRDVIQVFQTATHLEYTHAHACASTLLFTLLANIHVTRDTRGLGSVLIPLVFQRNPVPWYLDPKKLSDICCPLPFSLLSAISILSRKLGKLVTMSRSSYLGSWI